MKATSTLTILALITAGFAAACSHRRTISPAQVGVGLSVVQRPSRIVVAEIVPGSPAAAAGVAPGDTLLAIDGTPTSGIALSKVIALLQGPRGSDAKLVLQRVGEQRTREVHAKREPLIFLAVESTDLGPRTRYIRIRRFSPETPTDVARALYRAKGVETLILDLRSNPGGILDSAVRTAGIFLLRGAEIGFVESPRPEARGRFASDNESPVSFRKIFILVDHNTSAGAELFSLALQSAGLARVVGERTFGYASVETQSPALDHPRETVGWLLGPSGVSFDRIGVKPDIAAPGDPSLVYPPAKDPLVGWLLSRSG